MKSSKNGDVIPRSLSIRFVAKETCAKRQKLPCQGNFFFMVTYLTILLLLLAELHILAELHNRSSGGKTSVLPGI